MVKSKTNKTANGFLEDLEDEFSDPYTITKSLKTNQITNLYISKVIGAPHQYISLIDTLRSAHPTDTIYLYLNTPGGQLDTGSQIIHAMNDCPARVIAVLDGSVCSMGSLIFLSANEFIVHDHCQLMFHNYSGGIGGKGHEMASQLLATDTWFHTMLMDICCPFLEPDEVVNIINGVDMWLTSDQVRERLAVVVELMQQEQDALEQEDQDALEKEILKRIELREKKKAKLEAKKVKPASDE